MIELPRDFKDLLKSLNVHKVKYLLVGGYAVGYHGYVRATGDIDLWIESTAKNASSVCSALNDFGFAVGAQEEELLVQKNQILQMGVEPMRAEILTTIDGVEFAACWETRISAEIDEIIVPVIDLQSLKENKKASGRLKDLADLEELS